MGLFRRARPRAGDHSAITVFFATDLHGSEVCFKKFVRAAAFYGADVLVLGGDLTGKFLVPVVAQADGFEVDRHGVRTHVRADRIDDLERQLEREGLYPLRMTRADRDRLDRRPEEVDELFRDAMCRRLISWMREAREHLEGTAVRILTAPGNDDPPEVDAVIADHGGDRVLLLEGEVYELAPGHEMLSTGVSNLTPWHTHRECSEPELRRRLDELASRLSHPAGAVFNVHVPPYDSGLDTAPLIDEDLRVRTSAGAPLTGPVGSTAVREAIEQHQPLVSLHGHIHEGGGSARLGRTLAINAGSEYGEGVLRGALVTLGGGRIHRFQATTG